MLSKEAAYTIVSDLVTRFDEQIASYKKTNSYYSIFDNASGKWNGLPGCKSYIKTGRELHHHKVLNSELLILDENEKNSVTNIQRIELEQNK